MIAGMCDNWQTTKNDVIGAEPSCAEDKEVKQTALWETLKTSYKNPDPSGVFVSKIDDALFTSCKVEKKTSYGTGLKQFY